MDLTIYHTYSDIQNADISETAKKLKLIRLFQFLLDESLKDEHIHFTSIFSKIAYLGVRYELKSALLFELHRLRKRIEEPSESRVNEDLQILSYIIPKLYSQISSHEIPKEVLSIMPQESGIKYKQISVENYMPHAKFLCLEIDRSNKRIKGFLEKDPLNKVEVDFAIQDRNERFTQSILNIPTSHLPILIELIEVELDNNGLLRPSAFVIEPDFLIDVTSIANCFDHQGTKTISYLFRKFLPMTWSKALLMGNIANYFLDQLVDDKNIRFEETLKDVFKLDPLAFARIPDVEIPKLLEDMRKHFNNIKKSITKEFPKEKIKVENSYLEPSFMSAIYGLQGRLDFLHIDEDYTTIIELKSGGIYKPNVYGLKNDHYTQTLLYDLLIRSAFYGKKPRNYILYSKEYQKTLRIAPRIAAQQKEALKVRNELLQIEHQLADKTEMPSLLASINSNNYEDVKGFEATNITNFELAYTSLDPLELSYFHNFVEFTAKEHRLAKIGEYGQDKSNGLAGLWLDSHEEKCEQFTMLNKLEIEINQAGEKEPIIKLKFSKETNRLSNFRKGDIILLYPLGFGYVSPLKNQVFKCTILELGQESVIIRLRSPQNNQEIFKVNQHWAIEHDVMDTSFTNMYRQLFLWAQSPKWNRSLLLGLKAPKIVEHSKDHIKYDSLTSEQNEILNRMISAEDYYLVWGPPGTGKTSRIIRQYIQYMMDNTEENLYILAYTNRAVDEICACIRDLGESYEKAYLRIGSRYGSHEDYRANLLSSKIENITRRSALISTIKGHRMVVGTVASLASKEIIFELIPSKRVIIDESSQILEPFIIGLLSKFEQFILVGDHKQLPAVVVQSEYESKVSSDGLKEIGLLDRRDSLFERLYKRCLNQGWNHAIGQLKYQGRMHEDIMRFPNEQFYQKTLRVLPDLDRLQHQLEKSPKKDQWKDGRLLFKHVSIPQAEKFSKTNSAEVKEVIIAIEEYLSQGFQANEIGVITPFRAQIAAIKEAISDNEILSKITIDTVERFQGGARQVIIISFSCNSEIQFRNMISMSKEGIDRKLNVALTRAKERILLIGDSSVLRTNPLYDELLSQCQKV